MADALICPACSATNTAGQLSLLDLGREQDAARSLEQAVTEAEQLGHLPSVWTALGLLATTRTRLGDAQGAADAASAARAAVKTFGERLSESHRETLFARREVQALTPAS